MTDEPVISDAEVEAFHKHFAGHGFDARSALAAFLKARVPAEQRWGAIEADEVGGDKEYFYERGVKKANAWDKKKCPKPRKQYNSSRIGIVYFVQATTGFIKIGFTGDMVKRMKALQTANPGRLTVLGAFLAPARLELQLHRKFHDIGASGEWFFPDDRIRREIELLRKEFKNAANYESDAIERCFAEAAEFLKKAA